MRKSTRPAGGTSKPCSHIPDTRYYKGVEDATAVTGTFFLGPYQGGGETTPAKDLGSHPGDDGRGLPHHSEGMPTLPSI